MTDTAIISIYILLTIFVVATTAIFVAQDLERHLVKSYIAMSFCFVCWISLAITYRTTVNHNLALYIDDLPFIFIAFMPVALFVFSMQFYEYGRIKTKHILLLSIIPFMTSIIVIFPSLSWLLRTNHIMLEISPLHIAENNWNIWFYVHLTYSYILMIVSGVFIFSHHKKQASGYNLSSKFMVTGLFITLVCNILTIMSIIPQIDFTLIGTSLALTSFYLAIANNPTVEYLSVARKALYDFIDMPVFILDSQDRILDSNPAGLRLAKSVLSDNELGSYGINDVVEKMISYREVDQVKDNSDVYKNILLNHTEEKITYSMTRGYVKDKKNNLMGSYVFLMDITRLSQIIDDFEYKADIDYLTGIANRRAFEEKWEELNTAENLPISLIFGDINQLKIINDQMGHRNGDMLIKTTAAILSEIKDSGAFPARIGGDEFVVIIPNCNNNRADIIAAEIEQKLKTYEDRFIVASIALGTITKTEASIKDSKSELEFLMHEVDRRMYENKIKWSKTNTNI